MTCLARQHLGQMVCLKCVLHWDVNDPDPPECKPFRKKKVIRQKPPIVTIFRSESGRMGPKKDRLDHVRFIGQHEIDNQDPDVALQAMDYLTAHPAWGFDFITETWINHGV